MVAPWKQTRSICRCNRARSKLTETRRFTLPGDCSLMYTYLWILYLLKLKFIRKAEGPKPQRLQYRMPRHITDRQYGLNTRRELLYWFIYWTCTVRHRYKTDRNELISVESLSAGELIVLFLILHLTLTCDCSFLDRERGKDIIQTWHTAQFHI